jgi:ribosomal protein L37AE/L43A
MEDKYYIDKKQRIPVKCKKCGHNQQIIIDTKEFKCCVCNKLGINPAYDIIFRRIKENGNKQETI